MALGLTQPLTEKEYQEYLLRLKATGAWGWQPYHLHVPIVFKSRSLKLLEPSGPVQACNGTALPCHECTTVFLSSTCGFRQILMKLEFYWRIFGKDSKITFHENPSSGGSSCSIRKDGRRTDRQTDMMKLIVTFRNFANALKSPKLYVLREVFQHSQAHVLWDIMPWNAVQTVKQFPTLQGTWLPPPTGSGFGEPSAE